MVYRMDIKRVRTGPIGDGARSVESAANEPLCSTGRGASWRVPGESGVWIIILGELTLFSALFAAYILAGSRAPGLFSTAQAQLHPGRALFNTVVLLTSSLCVVLAVQAARSGRSDAARRLLLTAIAGGVAFLLVKVVEYGDLLREGYTPATNDFFMYYFVLTGLHLFHLIVGIGVLGVLSSLTRQGSFNERRMSYLESGGCFWHMVDIVWIVLFPLLYLVR